MRRWVCIVALLAGFSRDDYAWSARPRVPVAIERPFDDRRLPGGARDRGRGLPPPSADWWLRA